MQHLMIHQMKLSVVVVALGTFPNVPDRARIHSFRARGLEMGSVTGNWDCKPKQTCDAASLQHMCCRETAFHSGRAL